MIFKRLRKSKVLSLFFVLALLFTNVVAVTPAFATDNVSVLKANTVEGAKTLTFDKFAPKDLSVTAKVYDKNTKISIDVTQGDSVVDLAYKVTGSGTTRVIKFAKADLSTLDVGDYTATVNFSTGVNSEQALTIKVIDSSNSLSADTVTFDKFAPKDITVKSKVYDKNTIISIDVTQGDSVVDLAYKVTGSGKNRVIKFAKADLSTLDVGEYTASVNFSTGDNDQKDLTIKVVDSRNSLSADTVTFDKYAPKDISVTAKVYDKNTKISIDVTQDDSVVDLAYKVTGSGTNRVIKFAKADLSTLDVGEYNASVNFSNGDNAQKDLTIKVVDSSNGLSADTVTFDKYAPKDITVTSKVYDKNTKVSVDVYQGDSVVDLAYKVTGSGTTRTIKFAKADLSTLDVGEYAATVNFSDGDNDQKDLTIKVIDSSNSVSTEDLTFDKYAPKDISVISKVYDKTTAISSIVVAQGDSVVDLAYKVTGSGKARVIKFSKKDLSTLDLGTYTVTINFSNGVNAKEVLTLDVVDNSNKFN